MIRALQQTPGLRDPRNFLAALWRHLKLPAPTPVQYEIMLWITGPEERLVTKGFRGVGKSWLTSAACLYWWAMNPDTKIMVVSGSARRAADFTTFVRQVLESWDVVAELRPGPTAMRDSKLSFDVAGTRLAHAPSMTSLGVGGQLTGNRADKIIADDVETESNSDTQTKREKLLAHVQEFPSILSPGGQIIFLGTDQTEESMYRGLEGKGYKVRVWPARYPNPSLRIALGATLAPSIAAALDADETKQGQPTDPARFNHEELLIRETELGRSRFSLQFMLDPRLADQDRYPLRLSDLIVTPLDPDVAPERLVYGNRVQADIPCLGFAGDRFWTPVSISEHWSPYQGKVLAIDPAGRGKDEVAVAIVGQLHGYLFLLKLAAWLGEGYSDAVLGKIAALAAQYKVTAVVPEDNFGDGMFARLLEPHLHRTGHHCMIEPVKHSVQKERRIIETLEPVVQQHRLVVDPSVLMDDLRPIEGLPEVAQTPYRFAYQFSRITKDRGSLQRDDRLDVVAIAAAWWKDAMAQDAGRQQQAADSRAMDEEIRRFHEHGVNPLAAPAARAETWLARSTGHPSPPGSRRPLQPRPSRRRWQTEA